MAPYRFVGATLWDTAELPRYLVLSLLIAALDLIPVDYGGRIPSRHPLGRVEPVASVPQACRKPVGSVLTAIAAGGLFAWVLGMDTVSAGRTEGTHPSQSWRVGAAGERRVAEDLRSRTRADPLWQSLHSVPVGTQGSDIDHVVLGPGGVFTINT